METPKLGDKVTLKGGVDLYEVTGIHSRGEFFDLSRLIPVDENVTSDFFITFVNGDLIRMIDIPKPSKPIKPSDKVLLKPKVPSNETIKNEITWKTLAWFGWCSFCIGMGIGGYISLNS